MIQTISQAAITGAGMAARGSRRCVVPFCLLSAESSVMRVCIVLFVLAAVAIPLLIRYAVP
jgi:hypothetical protein